MAENPETFESIRGKLELAIESAETALSALISIPDATKQLVAGQIGTAKTQVITAIGKLDETQALAIANASEAITADFLKSSYEEASQLERYYGTTRIAASTLLLTIASGIGVALLSAIHTVGPKIDTKTIEWLRLGSFAIPIGIFFIMFYVNIYFEYWGNVANRVARYVEQLQILRMQSQKDFVEIWNGEGGRVAAAVRSVNRAQGARPITMIACSFAAVMILVGWVALITDQQLFTGIVWVKDWRDYVFWVAFFVIGALVVFALVSAVKTLKTLISAVPSKYRTELSINRKKFERLKALPLLPNLIFYLILYMYSGFIVIKNFFYLPPKVSIAHVKSYANSHRVKSATGDVGRINVFEANFVFVFFAAALYIATAIGVNKIPSTQSNASPENAEVALPTKPTPEGVRIANGAVPSEPQAPPIPIQSTNIQQPQSPSRPATLPPGTPETQFQSALNLARQTIRDRDLSDRAEIALSQVVLAYPQHQQVGEVQYWMGEIFFAREDWNRAMREFATHIQIHRRHARTMESLVRLGQALGKLGRRETACDTFTEFERRFPDMSSEYKDILASERHALRCPR